MGHEFSVLRLNVSPSPLSDAYRVLLESVYNRPVSVSKTDPEAVKRQPVHYALNRTPYREVLNINTVIPCPREDERIATRCPIRNTQIRNYFEQECVMFDKGDCVGLPSLSKVWDKIKTPEGHVHSNYGYMVLHLRDIGHKDTLVTPWEWAKSRLVLCEDTNQAVLLFLRPFHQYETNLDQPCTTHIQFIIREGRLHLFANMRSNDVVYGTPYNLMYFTRLLHRMVRELRELKYPDLEPGNLVHQVTSLHMYEKHRCMVAAMLGVTLGDSKIL